MKKILFSLIIIVALLGNINIAEAQYAHPATAIKSTNGNVQVDLNTLQANIGASTVEIALITAEIALIQNNLSTMEASLVALALNDATQESEIANITAEIDLIQTNLSTLEDLVDSNHAWTTAEIADITAEIALIQSNLGTIETRLDEHYANLETHELSINALITNDQTQETRIESTEVGLAIHENNVSNPHSVTATQVPYTDTYLIDATTVQSAIDTIELWLSSINVTNDSQDVAINNINSDIDSAEVAINLNNINDDSQDVQIENNHVAIILKADSDEIHTDISQAYVNVMEFGAVGNGIVDDAAAINAAIASLTSGGVVLFPSGYYCIKSQITLTGKHGITLKGVGHGKNTTYLGTNIYATGFNGYHFRGVDCVGISIENMNLTAEGQDSSFGVGGIYFSISSNSNNPYHSFKNLFISDISNNGITVGTPIMNNVTNVTVRKCVGDAFNMWGGTSTSFLNCYANNATETGFILTTMTYCTLQGCAAEGAGVGFYFDNSKSISLMGCGTEAIVDRGGAFNGYAYRSINGSNAVTLYDCYDRISATGTFSESAGGLLDYINHKTDSNAQITKIHSLPASSSVYTDTYSLTATNVQSAIDTIAVWLSAVDIQLDSLEIPFANALLDIDSAEVAINLNNIDDDSQDVTIESNRVRIDSAEVAINGIIVGSGYATTAQVSQEVLVHNADSGAHSALFAAVAATATEDIGTYIESDTTWEFDADYDTTAVLIYRNRLYQPRSLFTTVDVSSKTRVVFSSAIDASDEIILISNK